ncbi:MAG: hypothetical protein Q9185_006949 [Variospora sp. 1 TL-2023]
MSEDQELLARIGHLAGHINLHRAQPSPTQNGDPEKIRSHATGPNTTRGNSNWRAARHAPYGGRGRGASRRYPTSHSLVLNRENPPSPATKSASSSEKIEVPAELHSTPAYVSKRGRHKQLINSSVLDKVMQQRKQAIEGSKQRKILLNDQRERKRMQQYLEALDAGQGSAIVQTPQTTSNTIHHIEINGLTFQILKNGSKLARKFGTCRKKHCGLPHIDRAGQIRKHAAQVAATNNTGNGIDATENGEGDISSDEDDGVDTDGEDIDSDDLADDLIEGVDALGRQALAEQHDFVGL